MMWGYDGFGFGGGGMGIGMLLFWGLLIAGVVMLARGFGAGSDERPAASETKRREKAPLDVLGARYAQGEIGRSEFEEKRLVLLGPGARSLDAQRRDVLKTGGVEAS